MPSRFAEALAALRSGLAGVGRGWYLFGAHAALVYGSARLTNDIDVTLLADDLDVDDLLERLARSDFQPTVDDPGQMIRDTCVLPLLHRPTGVPVDVVIGGPGLEELFFEQSVVRQLGPVSVRVARPEHLVLMKLIAGRPKDLDDAEAVTRAVQVSLDDLEPLVREIAEALGDVEVARNLEQLRERLT